MTRAASSLGRIPPTLKPLLDAGIERFNAGRLDEAAADFGAAIRREPGACFGYYFRALARQAAGDARGARADVERALALAPRAVELRLKAADLAARRGDAAGALAHCRLAARARPLSDAARLEIVRVAAALLADGRCREALEACAAAAAGTGVGAGVRAAVALVYRDLGEYGLALAQYRAAASSGALSAAALWDKAGVETLVGAPAQALRSKRRAIAAAARALAAKPSVAARLWIADALENAGEFERALDELRRAAAQDPASPDVRLRLARLYLWRGQPSAAREHAGRVAAGAPFADEVRRVEAIAAALDGPGAQALERLDVLVASRPRDVELRVWRAQVLRRMGRVDEALAELVELRQFWGTPIGLLVNLALAKIAAGRDADTDVAALANIVPPEMAARLRKAGGETARAAAVLESILDRMGGNRTMPMTYVAGPLSRPRLRRHLVRTARDPYTLLQSRLRLGDVRGVLAEFDRLARRRPRDSQLLAHRGEVKLWCGRYADAEKDLLRALALDAALRWIEVGLAAARFMQGDNREALRYAEIAAGKEAAPTSISVWRTEILRALGEPRRALVEIEKDAATHFRPSTWVTWGLCLDRAGRTDEARDVLAVLRRRAPRFIEDALREEGLDPARFGARPAAAAVRRVLRRAHELMRGNRSSWFYSYWIRGRLRNIALRD